MRIKLPSVSYVVARSWPDSIIGRNNELPWHLRTDLQRFKSITASHPMIMGRKTHLSIGRALPGRANIVLSRTAECSPNNSFWQQDETMLLFVENLESALFFADVISIARGKMDVFVVGGAEMYRIFADLFNKVYLTEIMTGNRLLRKAEDAIFEYKFDNRQWKTIETHSVPLGPDNDFPSRFTILERKMGRIRYIDVKDYFTEGETRKKWVKEQFDLFEDFKMSNSGRPLSVPYQYQLFENG